MYIPGIYPTSLYTPGYTASRTLQLVYTARYGGVHARKSGGKEALGSVLEVESGHGLFEPSFSTFLLSSDSPLSLASDLSG